MGRRKAGRRWEEGRAGCKQEAEGNEKMTVLREWTREDQQGRGHSARIAVCVS